LIVLKQLEREESLYLITSEMQDCDLKYIYEKEGVASSMLMFLARLPVSNESDALVYSSSATHSSDLISIQDRIYVKAMYGRIKGALNKLIKQSA